MGTVQEIHRIAGSPSRVCRACGSPDCAFLGSLPARSDFAGVVLPTAIPGGALLRCPDCNLVFRSPILTTDEYTRLYAQASADVWVTQGNDLRTDQALLKAYIEAERPEGARILDVGCYTGRFLSCLPRKYEKFGIEASERAATCARESGITIVGDDFNECSRLDDRFDIVTAIDVIEHTADPSQFLGSMLRLLTEDGVALITTGDAENRIWRRVGSAFWYCEFAEHISFISERWLRSDAGVNRFRVSQLQRFEYEHRSALQTWPRLALLYVAPLLGIAPRASWTHGSADHLFVVLRREPGAATGGSRP